MDGVRGFDEVMRNLNEQIEGIKDRTMAGLLEASYKIQGQANKKVPVDTGNLVGSSYVRKHQDGFMRVEIGYTAIYAAWVHEMTSMRLKGKPRAHFGTTREGVEFGGGTLTGTYWAPNGEAKWLENTIRLNEKAIVQIVMERAKLDAAKASGGGDEQPG